MERVKDGADERKAEREAVDKHFEESLKKYKQSPMAWPLNSIPIPHSAAAGVAGLSPSVSIVAGMSPSMMISSIPPTGSTMGSLNVTAVAGTSSAAKKNVVNISNSGNGNASGNNKSDSMGGHVIDHHLSRTSSGPMMSVEGSNLIAIGSRNGGGGGENTMIHYDSYLPPPSAHGAAAAAEDQQRKAKARLERERELEAEHHHQQQQRSQHEQQQHHQHQMEKELEREREIERIRHIDSLYAMKNAPPPGSMPSMTALPLGYGRMPNGMFITPDRMIKTMQQAQPSLPMHASYQPYLYQSVAHQSKDMKVKSEMQLPAPPPLLSDIKTPSSVIVKHDTGLLKSQPTSSGLQVIQTSSPLSSGSKLMSPYKHQGGGGPPSQGAPPHSQALVYEYRNPGSASNSIVSIHAAPSRESAQHLSSAGHGSERYKTSPQHQRQSPAGYHHHQQPQQRQVPSPKQVPVGSSYGHNNASNKQKVSSPAPSYAYGKPEATGDGQPTNTISIGSGTPTVSRSTYPSMAMHVVSKSGPAESQRGVGGNVAASSSYLPRSYGTSTTASGPPPAHSRVFEVPSTWPYGGSTPAPHSSFMHSSSAAPPSAGGVSFNVARTRSPGGTTNPLHSISTGNHHSISISAATVGGQGQPHIPDMQTQPLDLGTSDRSRDSMHSNNSSESKSPPAPGSLSLAGFKRKSNTPTYSQHQADRGGGGAGMQAIGMQFEVVAGGSISASDMKKKRIEFLPQHPQSFANNPITVSQQSSSALAGQYAIVGNQSTHGHSAGVGPVAIQTIPLGQQQYLRQATGSVVYGTPVRKEEQSLVPQLHTGSVTVSVSNPIDTYHSQHFSHQPVTKAINKKEDNGYLLQVTHNQPSSAVVVTQQTAANTPSPVVSHSVTVFKLESNAPPRNIVSSPQSSVLVTKQQVTSAPIAATTTNSTTLNKLIVVPAAEKITSPALKIIHSGGGPRNLKKAWLQRHSGEDPSDDTTSVKKPMGRIMEQQQPGSLIVTPLEPAKSNGVNNGNGLNSNNNKPVQASGTSEGPLSKSIVEATGARLSVGGGSISGANAISDSNNKSVNNQISTPSGNNGSRVAQFPKKTTDTLNNSVSPGNKNKSSIYSDSEANEDSTSSDQERTMKTPTKKKQTKPKRKKAAGRKPAAEEMKKKRGVAAAVQATESDKNSDSEKDSATDKDSDSGTSTSHGKHMAGSRTNGKGAQGVPAEANDSKERRKRGRRPKTTKEEPLKKKQSKEEQVTATTLKDRKATTTPAISQLKKSGKSFLQESACHEMAPKLAKCRECRWTQDQRSKMPLKVFCRFYAFRRLRYTKNGQLAVAGFADPRKDPTKEDMKLWAPDLISPPTDLDIEGARFLVSQVADQFCELIQQEKEALVERVTDETLIAWKQVVQGMREMCDVCETTLFNYHWTCSKCGFAVCLDCYKSRKQGNVKLWGDPDKECDDFSWLFCSNRTSHDLDRLMLTQIITGDSLKLLDKMIHELRTVWCIRQNCKCSASQQGPSKALLNMCRDVVKGYRSTMGAIKQEESGSGNGVSMLTEMKQEENSLSWLADVALQQNENGNKNGLAPANRKMEEKEAKPVFEILLETLQRYDKNGEAIRGIKVITENEKGTGGQLVKTRTIGREKFTIRLMNIHESKAAYPDIPHSWLCDGKLLRLHDPMHPNNYTMFQEQWKRGQPVLISDVTKNLKRDLWTPESFSSDFGEETNDIVNCINGDVISNLPMKKFWDGFDNMTKRMKDDKGKPMLLKLKDWPPSEDFAVMLPERFADLMAALPLPDYTHRNGRLNLAGRLPASFVRPDLGPKMYNAYGSALHPTKGTTNLHMDISDAVNVMVYVGIPRGSSHTEETIKEAFRAIDEAGCDILTRRRVRDKGELPGALWHIYAPQDADKIRKLLNQVATEQGETIEPDHDPIHDQSWYLDGPLRERLYKSFGVEGYPIAQCLGDAIFIPAGAPHQVRNLHNCIKVAEDFVSPENISNCFQLTHEFRQLSDSHQNHEDKLQIKNIVYHTMKDALACLSHGLTKAAKLGGAVIKAAPSSSLGPDATEVAVKKEPGTKA